MPRVIGIDPGTLSIDVCGLDNGRVFLERTMPTGEALAEPSPLLDLIASAGPLDLIAGPSGYGLPLMAARDLTPEAIRLATLSAPGEPGGIGGLGRLLRVLAALPVPTVFTPAVIHLPSVPAHRKVNRVDMGTADKVCAATLAIREQAERHRCREEDTAFILLELGGAFSAALAVEHGRIVDGAGGSSGPLGVRAAGALDGEVAFLAGAVTKQMLFSGGVESMGEAIGWPAFIESAVKAVAMLRVSAPSAREVILSGRMGSVATIRDAITARLQQLSADLRVELLRGFARTAKHAAQGAALVADGLAGGSSAHLIDMLGIREARGSVLDHLHVVSPATARARLGLA